MYLQEVFRAKRRKKLSVGVLALSVTFGDSSPIGRAIGRPGHPDDISCIFYDRQLHSQTQSQEGNSMGSCILNRQDLAFDTPGTEAAGYQDTVAVT